MKHYKIINNKIVRCSSWAVGAFEVSQELAGKYLKLDENRNIVVDVDLENKKQLMEEEKAHLTYLASTDWYIIRQLEKGSQIPADVLTKREEARYRISTIRQILNG